MNSSPSLSAEIVIVLSLSLIHMFQPDYSWKKLKGANLFAEVDTWGSLELSCSFLLQEGLGNASTVKFGILRHTKN